MKHQEIFSAAGVQFTVSEDEHGIIEWNGDYRGMKVVEAFPIDHGTKCVILIDPWANKRGFQNLLCIDRNCNVVWIAELPEIFDGFVSLENAAGALLANSWSGYRVRIDPRTGRIVERMFTK